MLTGQYLKRKYLEGKNIIDLLKKNSKNHAFDNFIEVSYDLQSGSYIKGIKEFENTDVGLRIKNHRHKLYSEISRFGHINSLLEAGIGEATTLVPVLKQLNNKKLDAYGFDISWSRIAFAKQWCNKHDLKPNLFVGDMCNIPLVNNAIDVVFTSHAIEPNHGKEKMILNELYRVARKGLVLIEPAYEFATQAQKKRMDKHGYCRGLKDIVLSLGFNVVKHELIDYGSGIHGINPDNPAAILIIEKDTQEKTEENVLACPIYKTPLKRMGDHYYSEDSLSIFPVIQDIACLKKECAIVASYYSSFLNKEIDL